MQIVDQLLLLLLFWGGGCYKGYGFGPDTRDLRSQLNETSYVISGEMNSMIGP